MGTSHSDNLHLMRNGKSIKLWEIAIIIGSDWKNINFGAKPYLEAFTQLDTIDNLYGLDSGREIVCRFLANAQTWKGGTARAVKKHLNQILKNKVEY